jgi:hypothetical protein
MRMGVTQDAQSCGSVSPARVNVDPVCAAPNTLNPLSCLQELVEHPFWQARLPVLPLPPEPALETFISLHNLAAAGDDDAAGDQVCGVWGGGALLSVPCPYCTSLNSLACSACMLGDCMAPGWPQEGASRSRLTPDPLSMVAAHANLHVGCMGTCQGVQIQGLHARLTGKHKHKRNFTVMVFRRTGACQRACLVQLHTSQIVSPCLCLFASPGGALPA